VTGVHSDGLGAISREVYISCREDGRECES
jgi:hypothetical protein